MNQTTKSALAVFGGLATAIAVGWILLPVLSTIVDKYFFISDSAKEDSIIKLSVYLWLLIPTLFGGFVCSLIAPKKELNHVLVTMLLTLLGMVICFWNFVWNIEPKEMLMILMIPLGYFTGGRIGMAFKNRKKKHLEKTSS